MALQFKAVIFDLDGTLLDTSEGIISAIKHTIKKFKLPQLDENELLNFIGPPIERSLNSYYDLNGAELREIAAEFRNRYKDVDLLKAVPYDGIFNIFECLVAQNIKPAIATYKRQDYATMILTHFGFDKYTNILYGADFENKLTKKDIIEKALIDVGIEDYTQAVMVGDSDNDAVGAKELGINFIGVTYGFGFKTVNDVYKYPAVGAANSTYDLKRCLIGG